LNLPHDAFAHRFQCPVIQSARIIVSHAPSESRNTSIVKRNVELLMY
jgi:hypothetical protein